MNAETIAAALVLAVPSGLAAQAVSESAFFSALEGAHQVVRASLEQTQTDVLVARLKDSSAELSARRQAAKALSPAAGDQAVSRALLDVGADSGAPDSLRALCYKALAWQAATLPEVREALLSAASSNPDEVRRGAIWGLYQSGGFPEVRGALLSLALQGAGAELRVEALKSLYGVMDIPDIREPVKGLIRDSASPGAVRCTAILMLSSNRTEDETDLLRKIAAGDADPYARRAALTALGDPASDAIYRYFHLVRRDWRYPYPVVRDPINDE